MTEGTNNRKALFEIGQTVVTPGALNALDQTATNGMALLFRHQTGDWGYVADDDAEQNNQAISDGSRILSIYKLGNDLVIWVITEADRSVTTLLLPEEY